MQAEPRDPWAGRLVDLRVDRSNDPLAELRRLLDGSDGYDGFGRAVGALFSGDPATALASADEGLSLLPGEENLRLVRAGVLAASGDNDGAGAEPRALIAARLSWATIVRGFAAKVCSRCRRRRWRDCWASNAGRIRHHRPEPRPLPCGR